MNKNADVVKALRKVVGTSYALMAQTHLCHWNVRGANFFSLHTAFEEQYTELFAAIDEIAERIRALGELAPGGLASLAAIGQVEEIAEDAKAADMAAHIAAVNAQLVEDLAAARDLAGEAGDSETEDLMIARTQVHQKHIWMLKSYLEV
ncbi:Dps family protein [Persicirhabdus sediminis]|uniref:DNA starvation/stationary phase protection protein n=1 Tax=Persicirhabdus sediminis TaxID=454144 RepID=A0A8J7SHX8_9BACT|nr:Dps family protein [Persicirhabdus sediminis]MBK1790076.1 DNA starvation/stationary phase protection protein [Persicirhabdus sediminis]